MVIRWNENGVSVTISQTITYLAFRLVASQLKFWKILTNITLNHALNGGKVIVFHNTGVFMSVREVIFSSPLGQLLIPRSLFLWKVLCSLFYLGPTVDFSVVPTVHLGTALEKSLSVPFLLGYSSVVQSMSFRLVRICLEIYLPLVSSITSVKLLYIDKPWLLDLYNVSNDKTWFTWLLWWLTKCLQLND